MLGPVLVCHKKDKKAVKLLCDTLLDVCPGLAENVKVLGADGENSILNQTCNEFPFATLLLCIRHIEENFQRKLPKNATDTKRNEVMTTIFGNDSKKGLVDSQSIEEFETEVPQFYASLSLEKEWIDFLRYFKRSKADIIKYHVIKGAVNACELNDIEDKFYNNSIESMDKLIKHWQNYKKVDLFFFSLRSMKN